MGGSVKVVITLADASGQAALHTFELTVERSAAAGTSKSAAAGEYAKVDSHRLELPDGDFTVAPDGTASRCCWCRAVACSLAPDGIALEKEEKLPSPYIRIAERANYFRGPCRPTSGA